MLKLKLKTLISRAKKNGACDSHIAMVSKYYTTDDAKCDRHAPYWICWYLKNVVKGVDGECEKILLKNHPRFLYNYIQFCKKERWPEGEKRIIENSEISTYYAIHFLGKRWLEAETTIYKSKIYWNMYAKKFGLEKQEEN